MKPRPFDYVRPDTVDEAVALLAELGDDARVMAGGQSLMAILNLRLAEPKVIIDIGGHKELNSIRIVNGMLEVGASVTQNELLSWPHLPMQSPMLAKALPWVGHFQTRNRGTICGSLSHADPSSEIPLSLAVLGGEVVLRSKRGTRTVAAEDFQVGLLSTARESDEMMIAARFPVGSAVKRAAFREVARRHGDFAILSLAAIAETDTNIRFGIGGLADRPIAARIDLGPKDAVKDAMETLAWELEGTDDIHATARYRRDLLRRLGPTVIEEALACAA
ncbi:MAG: xanthine dehydrogenase family protein subunit M [Hyphomicrobiaceae bacterium]